MSLSGLDTFKLLRMFGPYGGADHSEESNYEICRRFMPEQQIAALRRLGTAEAAAAFEWHATDILNTPEIGSDWNNWQRAHLHYSSESRDWYILSRGAERRPYATGIVFEKGRNWPETGNFAISDIIAQGAAYDTEFRPIHTISDIVTNGQSEPLHTMPCCDECYFLNLEGVADKYLPRNQYKRLLVELDNPRTPGLESIYAKKFFSLIASNIGVLQMLPPPRSPSKCDELSACLKYTRGENSNIHCYIISRKEPGVRGSSAFGFVFNAETKAAGYQFIDMAPLLVDSNATLDFDFRQAPMSEIKTLHGVPLEGKLTVKDVIGDYEAELVRLNRDASHNGEIAERLAEKQVREDLWSMEEAYIEALFELRRERTNGESYDDEEMEP